MSEEIRVRFPPSPTGDLHIGGARTALYNWLFCRKHGGRLVLRIEDTDVERSTEASSQGILDGLEWMGIDWDEGPYRQSEHAAEHRQTADQLLAQGLAYRCYCTTEELQAKREARKAEKQSDLRYDRTCLALDDETRARYEQEGRPSVMRFRVPESLGENGDIDKVVLDDLVFGRIETRLDEIDDFVIVRSNGLPLYILSNVIDDHRDRITHVIRGADHLTNTPKQVLLYLALGWPVPRFAHMALTLDAKKAKISKRRHGDVVAVRFYAEHGFLPEAFNNFMALLGWSPGDDTEVFLDRRELIDRFSLAGVSKSNSVFNYNPADQNRKFITDPKAIHINTQHLRALPVAELAPHVEPVLDKAGLWSEAWAQGGADRDWFLQTIDLIRTRFHLVTDFATAGAAYFGDDFAVDEKAYAKRVAKDARLKELLPQLADCLEAVDPFDGEATETAVRELAEKLDVKVGLLANAARVLITGQAKGPGIFEVFETLGKTRVVARIRRGAAALT